MLRIFGTFLLISLFVSTHVRAEEDKELTEEDFQELVEKLIYYQSKEHRDSVDYFAHKAEEACKLIDTSATHNPKIIDLGGDIYSIIARHSISKNLFLEAILNLTKAEGFYTIIKDDKQIASILRQKAEIYLNIDNKIKALENYYRLSLLYEELNDSLGLVKSYIQLATIYKEQDNFQQTQKTLEKASEIAYGIDEPSLLSEIRKLEAEMTREMGDTEYSLYLFEEALTLAKISSKKRLEAQILNNIGELYLASKNYQRAKSFFTNARAISVENNFNTEEVSTLIQLGYYYLAKDSIQTAIDYANLGEKKLENRNRSNLEMKVTELLLKIYETTEDWQQAYHYQSRFIDQKERNERKIIDQIVQQETIRLNLEREQLLADQKEVERMLLLEKDEQRRNIIYLVTTAIFILLILLVLSFYVQLKSSKERNRIITSQSEERKLLLQEVHHRVKNNFQMVSSMLRLQSHTLENEELRQSFSEAVNRINSMAIVHEVIYQQEKFKDINANTYLKKLVEILEKTSHSDVRFEIDAEDILFRIETLISIGITLNELITNSYKHAFDESIFDPRIRISLKELGTKSYQLIYQDNGVGIDKKTLAHNFGMDLVETIIESFDGSIEIRDEDPTWPTTFVILFNA